VKGKKRFGIKFDIKLMFPGVKFGILILNGRKAWIILLLYEFMSDLNKIQVGKNEKSSSKLIQLEYFGSAKL
jgi:hypothetical protein